MFERIGSEVGRAVYGLPQHYDRCLLVGHSLGSVVAYDMYNRMVNEGAGTNWDVQGGPAAADVRLSPRQDGVLVPPAGVQGG